MTKYGGGNPTNKRACNVPWNGYPVKYGVMFNVDTAIVVRLIPESRSSVNGIER